VSRSGTLSIVSLLADFYAILIRGLAPRISFSRPSCSFRLSLCQIRQLADDFGAGRGIPLLGPLRHRSPFSTFIMIGNGPLPRTNVCDDDLSCLCKHFCQFVEVTRSRDRTWAVKSRLARAHTSGDSRAAKPLAEHKVSPTGHLTCLGLKPRQHGQ
jgi:hypothetical protein